MTIFINDPGQKNIFDKQQRVQVQSYFKNLIEMNVLLKFIFCVLSIAHLVTAKALIEDSIVFRDDNEYTSEEILKPDGPKKAVKIIPGEFNTKETFQGDIKVGILSSRTGVKYDSQKWPKDENGFAIVPFAFDLESNYGEV